MRRRLLGLLASAVAVFVSVALTAAVVTPPHRGVVTGGIMACRALDNPGQPHYVAGTVIVLRGDVTWRAVGPAASVDVLPTAVAGRQTVSADGMYRFDLDAGHYVLLDAARPGDYGPYATVTVGAGEDLLVDIPNSCI
ncbi:MAG TPA: hypothetical protein VJT78_09145 [Candidatus Dormibacteraeota bacterium]|nr:hypothetical protein [Candidatus Dormibacteraeota bacterium]